MSIKERFLKVAENKGIAKQLFCENIGLTYGGFTGDNKKRPINSDAIANLLVLFPDVNPEWLLTGKGEMLKSSDSPISQSQQRKVKDNSTQQPLDNTFITYLQTENKKLQAENKELQTENKELNKQIGRLEGKLESAYQLMEDLKKEIPAPGLFRAAVQ